MLSVFLEFLKRGVSGAPKTERLVIDGLFFVHTDH